VVLAATAGTIAVAMLVAAAITRVSHCDLYTRPRPPSAIGTMRRHRDDVSDEQARAAMNRGCTCALIAIVLIAVGIIVLLEFACTSSDATLTYLHIGHIPMALAVVVAFYLDVVAVPLFFGIAALILLALDTIVLVRRLPVLAALLPVPPPCISFLVVLDVLFIVVSLGYALGYIQSVVSPGGLGIRVGGDDDDEIEADRRAEQKVAADDGDGKIDADRVFSSAHRRLRLQFGTAVPRNM